MAADDPYRDPDLVTLYDLDNPPGDDHAYYRALADEIDARTIVDLGCGTGRLTRSLLRPGRTVVGIDPSRTMLAYARRQPGAESVTWLHGDASSIAPTATADLVICTGNAIMHIGPADLAGALRSVAGGLRVGGTVSFESRNPAARAWEHWTPEATYGERDTAFGRLREWLEVTTVDEGRVVFDAHNVFADGERRIFTTVLYFRGVRELEHELRAAGFVDVVISGDWHGGPVTEGSTLLVFRARKGGQAVA